jgi:hypothetical protein
MPSSDDISSSFDSVTSSESSEGTRSVMRRVLEEDMMLDFRSEMRHVIVVAAVERDEGRMAPVRSAARECFTLFSFAVT